MAADLLWGRGSWSPLFPNPLLFVPPQVLTLTQRTLSGSPHYTALRLLVTR